MVRNAFGTVAAVLLMAGILSDRIQAIPPVSTIEWVGGANGEWNDANAWKNLSTNVTGDALTLMGDRFGSEGMNNIDPAVTKARHIVIGGGATVDFDARTANNDMTGRGIRLRQGTTLTIKDGATWVQDQSDHTTAADGVRECRCDPSELILDGGTWRRTGANSLSGGQGGNAIFGSYNDDNNLERLGTLPPRANIEIKNGGRFENEGQLWFGTDGESAYNTRVSFTINNGHMDLTGGGIPIENGEMTALGGVVGDLAFFYDHKVYDNPAFPDAPSGFQNEEFEINFTGPGSITVDSAGIRVLRQPAPANPGDPDADWTGRDVQVSYQDLWNAGILKANGLSGAMGEAWSDSNDPRILQQADFDMFFSVTGTPGTDGYTLTAKPATTIPTIEWVGGANGEWNDANAWKNLSTNVTGDALTLMGDRFGSEGMNNIDPAVTKARHIVIGGGATVDFDARTANNDMTGRGIRLRQGTTLTIKDGATWVQDQSDHTTAADGVRECRCDPSELILDGGTWRRTGANSLSGGQGGNAIFGSYNDDNNLERLGTLPPRANIEIKNGGRFENEGQLWFGTDGESAYNTRVSFTINNGHMDLTGGGIPIENGEMTALGGVVGDLAFFYDHKVYDNPAFPDAPSGFQNEEFEINFTGPGSITVDSAGIRVLRQPAPANPGDPDADWTGRDVQVSYQDLWNQGILKANGLSGKVTEAWSDSNNPRTTVAADFDKFFSVTGTPGMDNYMLTSLIEGLVAAGITGDFNNDGAVDAADYVLWRNGGQLQNDPTPGVQAEDYNTWRANFGRTTGSGGALSAAVPEPSSLVLFMLALGAGLLRRRVK